MNNSISREALQVEIINKIYENNLQDDIFYILSVRLLEEKNKAVMDNVHHKAIFRLINKVTKDKTVKNILEDEGGEEGCLRR